jgi:hypothetical protein
VARRRVHNLPFDVLECDACGRRSPLDVAPHELDDWLVVTYDGAATHLCPDCHGAVSAPRRFERSDDEPAPLFERRAQDD